MTLVTNFIILTVFLFEFIVSQSPFTYTPRIRTDKGPVIGLKLKTVKRSMPYYSFRGIPYAKPPIDERRFEAPSPKRPWLSPFYAIKDGNNCIQMHGKDVIGSDDCLYLNVYTPTLRRKAKLSVIVWIHGGAFRTGNGNSSYYGPDFLVEKDVVVVSMNYRLGALGFMNMNHPAISANNGLKDQNMALRWVRRNIRRFGGDSRKVTLLGQSAGGVSVDLHKLSPMSARLFDKTISMSASPLCLYWAFQKNEDAEDMAIKLGKKFSPFARSKTMLVYELKTVPAADIVMKANEFNLIPFRPTIERIDIAPDKPKFLTDCVIQIYKTGTYNKGPHMMGYTSLEALEFLKVFDDVAKVFQQSRDNVNKYSPVLRFISHIRNKIYSSLQTEPDIDKRTFYFLLRELSDIFFVAGIDKKQQLLSINNDYPVYYYRFDVKHDDSAHKLVEGIQYLDGVAHEDELPYLFYRSHIDVPLNDTLIASMREKMVTMWTNFAKYGEPLPPSQWPDSRPRKQFMHIGNEVEVKEMEFNAKISLYESLGILNGASGTGGSCDRS